MGPPVCQIKAYQKVSPKLKHANFTHKSADWSLQLEDVRNLRKKSMKCS